MSYTSSTRRGMLLGGTAAAAAPNLPGLAAPGPGPMTAARANSGVVGVISGGVDGTYIRIAADLAAVLDDGDWLRVLPVVGKGSVQNLSDIIYLRGIDVGIVQSDALAFVRHENTFPGIGQIISYVAKLYDEEVHILARREIGTVEDLRGKKVNVDGRTSGTAMTASVLFNKLQIPIEMTYDTQSDGLERLARGDISAVMYVAGKPATLFTRIPADQGLHFLSLPLTDALLETYLPAQLGRDAYPALIGEGARVDTLAVGAVMAVYDWPTGSERYRKVARFVTALSSRFAEFQKSPRHPKWREVNLEAQIPGWKRFVLTPDALTAGALRTR